MIVNADPTRSGVLRGELWWVCVCVIVECMEGKNMRWFGVWWSRKRMKGWQWLPEVVVMVGRWTWSGGDMHQCCGAALCFEKWMAPTGALVYKGMTPVTTPVTPQLINERN